LEQRLDLISCNRGASAVEFGLSLTVFLGLIFGIINIARVLWVIGSLHFAAESAARCASANTTTCNSASAIQTYALNQYHGESLGGTKPFHLFGDRVRQFSKRLLHLLFDHSAVWHLFASSVSESLLSIAALLGGPQPLNGRGSVPSRSALPSSVVSDGSRTGLNDQD